jgi:hypothetical protein
MAVIEIAKIQVRRGQENLTGMPQLDAGEFGWAEDTETLYIGKRIVEGAVDDNNTEVVTSANFLKHLSKNALALSNTSTTYQYRATVEYIASASTTRSLQSKLDDINPSLTDFGVITSFSNTDITLEFQNAVATIFANPTNEEDARRTLRVPAGKYTISQPIDLPPFTRLIGEGQGLTVITVLGDSDLFRTVDGAGNRFDAMDDMSDSTLPRDIYIEGMTLQCSTASAYTTSSIIKLDNVNGAVIKDCQIGSSEWYTTSTIYPFGTGIHIRGNLGNGLVGDTVQCKDILIDNCTIVGLNVGLMSTGTVIRPTIQNNLFGTLVRGIHFSQAVGNSPTNSTIVDNRFQNIEQEGIFVGTASYRTSHLSSNNFFINVGNGRQQFRDATTSTTGTSAIIVFHSDGNKTVNDYFYRRDFFNSISTTTDYVYPPLVYGSASIDDDGTYKSPINNNTLTYALSVSSATTVCKFNINDRNDQMITVNYQMTATNMSRKGTVMINLRPDGNTEITDTYNFVDEPEVYNSQTTDMLPNRSDGQSNVMALNTDTYTIMNDISPIDGIWYITGNNVYANLAADLTARIGHNTSTTSTYFLTLSSNPTFNFGNQTEQWTLVRGKANGVTWYTETYTDKNYITLVAKSINTQTCYLEYQVNIVQ